jgi:hypothetical protein
LESGGPGTLYWQVQSTEEVVMSGFIVDVWTFREQSQLGFDPLSGRDLTGYKVEAIDGSIGKVDDATYEAGSSFLIVDTGPWIFGKKVMLPAGVIQRVDEDDEVVYVNRTKDQIKNAPEYDESRTADPEYRSELGGYYGQGGTGYRDWQDDER